MPGRRPQLAPWRNAGRVAEAQRSADEVIRETGWVFNNETGQQLTLAEFVATGTEEVGYYCHHLGLHWGEHARGKTFVEIGAGIGRMTAALTRTYSTVIACDLDAAFLEQCRSTVAQHGDVSRLQTAHVSDGHTLELPDACADVVFSYITLQHCDQDDALGLLREAFRVARPGARIALNFRTWTLADLALVPIGKVVRGVWRVVPPLARAPRLVTRFGWQANRLKPEQAVRAAFESCPDLASLIVFQSDRRRATLPASVSVEPLAGIHPSHYWLVATR
jgi:SAM-dependent methyltransferase